MLDLEKRPLLNVLMDGLLPETPVQQASQDYASSPVLLSNILIAHGDIPRMPSGINLFRYYSSNPGRYNGTIPNLHKLIRP